MQRYCKDKIYVNLCQKSTDLNKGNEMKESSDAKKSQNQAEIINKCSSTFH